MTASLMLVLKLTLTPLLVAAMSLAAKRFGPTFGGLLMGLPWMTGPILLFLALEKGVGFAVDASVGVLIAVIAIACYLITYAWVSRVADWPVSIVLAALAFGASGYGLTFVGFGALEAALLGAGSLIVAYALMPRLVEQEGPRALPWWDIPMRMAATALMVAAISFTADRIGARLSGVVASFPVIATVIGCFSHARWGAPAVIRLFKAMSLSLIAFVAFFTVTSFGLEGLGIVGTFALATIAGVTVSGLMIFASRRKLQPHQAGAAGTAPQ